MTETVLKTIFILYALFLTILFFVMVSLVLYGGIDSVSFALFFMTLFFFILLFFPLLSAYRNYHQNHKKRALFIFVTGIVFHFLIFSAGYFFSSLDSKNKCDTEGCVSITENLPHDVSEK